VRALPPSVTTRVRVVVDIPSRSTWAASTTMAQIVDQAKTGATNTLRKALKDHGFTIVGEPVVTAVLAREEGIV
jgi:3-methyladenine DNA glycosylase Tag